MSYVVWRSDDNDASAKIVKWLALLDCMIEDDVIFQLQLSLEDFCIPVSVHCINTLRSNSIEIFRITSAGIKVLSEIIMKYILQKALK